MSAQADVAGVEGLTQTLWYGLNVFSGAPLAVQQAARRLGTSRQAVQRTANELLARGLVVTERNPDHRASIFVMLTAEGRAALERVTAAAKHSRPSWFADADIARLRAAHEEVRRLGDAVRLATRTADSAGGRGVKDTGSTVDGAVVIRAALPDPAAGNGGVCIWAERERLPGDVPEVGESGAWRRKVPVANLDLAGVEQRGLPRVPAPIWTW